MNTGTPADNAGSVTKLPLCREMGDLLANRVRVLTLALGLVFWLAGCGGQSQASQTAATAKCLRVALVERAIGGDNCGDPNALKAVGQSAPHVTCTHQNANQYVCHATAAAGLDYLNIGDRFYDVTYDGKSLYYQQTP